MVHLLRLSGVKDEVITILEQEIPKHVQRNIGPPPEGEAPMLQGFIEMFFEPNAEYHRRSDGNKSQWLNDLELVAEMMNGKIKRWGKLDPLVLVCRASSTLLQSP